LFSYSFCASICARCLRCTCFIFKGAKGGSQTKVRSSRAHSTQSRLMQRSKLYTHIKSERCAWIKQAAGPTTRAASGYLAVGAQLSPANFPPKNNLLGLLLFIFATFYCGTHVGENEMIPARAAAHNTVCGALLEFQLAARLLGQFARRAMP
jgi:hypothetical protein